MYTIIAALISVIGVFATIYVGLGQFKKQQDYNRGRLFAENERDRETRKQELNKYYWEQQMAIYKEACDAVATIASATTLVEVQTEGKTFWRLYWGRMSLIENQKVATAMITYGKQLDLCEKGEDKPASLKGLAWAVANTCRDSLKETWSPVEIETLKPSQLEGKDSN